MKKLVVELRVETRTNGVRRVKKTKRQATGLAADRAVAPAAGRGRGAAREAGVAAGRAPHLGVRARQRRTPSGKTRRRSLVALAQGRRVIELCLAEPRYRTNYDSVEQGS